MFYECDVLNILVPFFKLKMYGFTGGQEKLSLSPGKPGYLDFRLLAKITAMRFIM